MNKLFYPAIFHKEDDGFWVSFPDQQRGEASYQAMRHGSASVFYA